MSAMIQVSMVANAHATETKPVQLLTLLREIKDGRWQRRQDLIRAKREKKLRETGGDLKAAKLAIKRDKEALPGATFAGLFSYRANDKWTVPSGLLPADLDNLDSDLPAVREKLRQSPHLFFDCESVTGSGLRALVVIPIGDKPDEEKYHACFEAVRQHVLSLCGVEIDRQCKDPVRLSFVCADRNSRLNLKATPIALLPPAAAVPKAKAKARASADAQCRDKPSKEQVREMLAVIPKRPDYPDWIKLVAAVRDGLPEADAIELLNEWSPEEEEGEYAKKLRKRLKNIHVGTLIPIAKQYGWTGQTQARRAGGKAGEQPKESGEGVEPSKLPDLGTLLDDISRYLSRFVFFSSDAQPVVLALWIAHAWAIEAFDVTPYPNISSAEKRSGKTQLLECLSYVVPKTWLTLSPSEAVLYRKTEKEEPTLLLDESDALFLKSGSDRQEIYPRILKFW